MNIPGAVTFKTFREGVEDDDEDLCASDPNSVMQSVQTQPLLEQSQSVPPVTQTFANQEITPKPKVA